MKNNWPIKKLSDLLQPVPQSAKLTKKEMLTVGRFPVVDQSQNLISGYSSDEHDLYPGDLPVIVFGDHTLILKFIDFPFVRGADGTQIIKASGEIDIKYLFYYLEANPLQSRGYSRHLRYLKETEIPVPPIEIQNKIVERLDAICQAQELNDWQILKVEELFEACIQESFSEEYPSKKLCEVCDVRDGTHDSPKYQKNGTPLITSKNLKNDSIDFQNIKFVSDSDRDKINQRSRVDQGDIIFGMIGTIGNPVLIDTRRGFCIKNVALIKPPTSGILNRYILYFLKSKSASEYLFSQTRGGTQKFVSLKNIRDMQIPIPTINEQQKIIEKNSAICDYKKSLLKQKELLQELFNSVLYKSMKGEMD